MTTLGDLLPATLIAIACFFGSLHGLRVVKRDRAVTVIGRSRRQTFIEGSQRYGFYMACVKGLVAFSGFATVFMIAVDCVLIFWSLSDRF